MTDNQTVTRFELLPNEILIQCFQHLDALQIFSSFDQLNSRFNELIRCIPLHLHFRNYPHSLCQRFCDEMLRNPSMRESIHSLHLSNKDEGMWIEFFLEMFAFETFPSLQSLTLIDAYHFNHSALLQMLWSVPSLQCFHLKDSNIDLNEIFSQVRRFPIRTLTLPRLSRYVTLLQYFVPLTSLTIETCNRYQLLQVLNAIHTLKYLQINNLSREAEESDRYDLEKFTHSLQHLVINNSHYRFNDIEMIIVHTPDLRRLTLFVDFQFNWFSSDEWNHWFHTYLPRLQIFKFCFRFHRSKYPSNVEEDLTAFQNSLQPYIRHHSIECFLSSCRGMIYTVPYAFSTFKFHAGMRRFHHTTIDGENTFGRVRQLKICTNEVERYDYHHYRRFSHREPRRSPFNEEYIFEPLRPDDIQCIIENFSHVKHLDVSKFSRQQNPSVLMEILRRTPHVTSLTMTSDTLISSLENTELRQYLQRMIRKLTITNSLYSSYENNIQWQLCVVFTNLQQLTCTFREERYVTYFLTHLPKLIRAQFTVTEWNQSSQALSLYASLRQSGMYIHMEYSENRPEQITCWINRETTDN
ncbi:unnamed protein product [Adineta ricciae]|uniref:F-box domain-containing protein n=1 Tax=Adineta ricciae TaxID=249248 RepID=A0A815RC36_ADIRI|nr:unnamed protein product [Adineta ricciae]CAF1628939.1 unnamed protein product [Adineta ricciae]